MDNYRQLTIDLPDNGLREILIAQLSDMGFDGFEETDTALSAYITEGKYQESTVNDLLRHHDLHHTVSIVGKQNWNAVWESNFEPVRIDDFVGVRAGFHPPLAGIKHEIIITPKMSFGTGHHATTYLVMQLMEETAFEGKTVFDFGTGTGILAILAEKLGSASVLAVDHDHWCIENASENISINKCQRIDIEIVENGKVNKKFDIIIANINKNIILDNLSFLADGIKAGGEVLLSGLLAEDEADILKACATFGWKHGKTAERSGWIACRFKA